ncbi:unnamed protein product, partial [marine sediment metagenome]
MFKIEKILPSRMERIAKFQYKGEKFLFMFFVYLVLVGVAFIFLYPLIYMVVTSLKTVGDIV